MIFKDKKIFCIEYQVKKETYLFTLKAYSDEDAIERFKKKFTSAIFGFYPYPQFEILSVRRIHKKIQF